MTDTTEGLRIALEASEADLAMLRAENAALLERMVRAEKGEQSARACMAVLLPEEALRALERGKAIDDGEMEGPALLREENECLRARIAELNDALDRADGENGVLRAQNAYLAPRQRAGQIVANAMYVLDHEFYEAHRCTAIDPFNHDESVGDYLRAWREASRAIVREYLAAADRWDELMGELEAFKARHVEAWWMADGYAALSDRIATAGQAKLAARKAMVAAMGGA